MPRAKPVPGLREISLDLIDPPSLAMRQSMDPARLEELTASIRQVGMLVPLILHPQNGRYEIEDGHRRFICATRAGLKTAPAIVRTSSTLSGEAVKCHVNWHREDVNAAEEAVYMAALLERDCAGDVDKLCTLVGERREYIEGRLLLLRGDPEVFQALQERRISMAVARELNKIPDRGYRLMYLDAAMRGGATARLVTEWRQQCAAVPQVDAPPSGDGTNQHTAAPAPIMTMRCACCEQSERPWDLELIYLCKTGCRQLVDRLLAKTTGVQ